MDFPPPDVASTLVPNPSRNNKGCHQRSEDKIRDFLAKAEEQVHLYRHHHEGQNPLLSQLMERMPAPYTWRSMKTFYTWSKNALRLIGYSPPDMKS
jgi:hypothetical protein